MTHDPVSQDPEAEGSLFRHSAAIYDTDAGFLAEVVPFVEEGLTARDPVILTLNAAQQGLLASVIGNPHGVEVLVAAQHYAHPLSALRANRTLFEHHLRAGAARVRIVGDLPREDPSTWRNWARYEALCNHHFADLAISALCTYDTRNTSAEVLADVRRLHALLADPDGRRRPSPAYVEPAAFLQEWSRTAADPLEAGTPRVVLTDPEPSDGRRAAAAVAASAGVAADGLVTAVSEAVTNAHLHGRPPVTLRAWTSPGRIVITVTDTGPGPSDPFTGLLPPDVHSLHGRGLWIANHLCGFVAISADDHGCVVRMVAEADASSLA
jgi:anti-sigma regulatory factor (Ser/Thr protein kinase)